MRTTITSALCLLAFLAGAQPGAYQLDALQKRVQGHRIALLVNQTSLVGKTHLIDTLVRRGVHITKIFAPEHGYRGDAADGDLIQDSKDAATGIPVVSLYGKNFKPQPEQLADIDIVIFDVQDVGARFYTYISTLTYLMEACAASNKTLLILDRPNPHGGYIDGPILRQEHKSFVGLHPLPVVHGMTVGELAGLLNGEGWLAGGVKCKLEVIKATHWKHGDPWHIAVRPSPNLPNDQAIALYPSICFFEGTAISVGRGTQIPFQIIGNPLLKDLPFTFTPIAIEGMSTQPPHKDVQCYGFDLRTAKVPANRIDLSYLLDMYKRYPDKEKFFIPYFEKLTGTSELRKQIIEGLTEEQIRESWKKDLESFRAVRSKYLLYP